MASAVRYPPLKRMITATALEFSIETQETKQAGSITYCLMLNERAGI